MAEDSVCFDDVINILVATDIHLGYAERDPERGEDSFTAFEEILQLASSSKVDFILLGGDLFHDSKPSPTCLHKCITLLKKYCLGESQVEIEFISDPKLNFSHCSSQTVNYEDPNLNISIPVFSIHGNHDDPSGLSQLSALDILSSMGLVNYFGKITNLKEIEIIPLLLRKNNTNLAMYGLSHIKDSRLARLFKDDKVTLFRPSEEEDWFSIMALHQNRAERGHLNYVPESMLPDFLNFVLWGHEHDCRIECEESAANGVQISQPGSSVATSLSQEESGKKYVGLLSINKTNFKYEKIQLKSVRPFLFQHSNLDDFEFDSNLMSDNKKIPQSEQVEAYVKNEIERLIIKAKDLHTGHPKQPLLPLIRFRVEYDTKDQEFNPIRAGQQFVDKVANPNEIVLLKKSMKHIENVEARNEGVEFMEKSLDSRVESKVLEYFENVAENEKKKMSVLTPLTMCQGLMAYIDKNDAEAMELLVDLQIEKTLAKLKENPEVTQANLDQKIEEVVKLRYEKLKEEEEDANNVLNNPNRKMMFSSQPTPNNDVDMVEYIEDDDDEVTIVSTKPSKAKGRATAAAAPKTKTPARATRTPRGNSSARNHYILEDDSDDEPEILLTPSKRVTRRGRPSTAAATKAANSPSPTKTELPSQYTPTQNRRAATVSTRRSRNN